MNRLARLVLPTVLAFACSDVTTELVGERGAQLPGDAAAPADSAAPPTMPCGDHVCACNNGRDEDADDLVDGFDPECTGPFDDDESSFATGTPDSNPDCQDCFWDGDSESADDGCAYHSDCLLGQTPTGATAAGCPGCEVSARCVEQCGERTPNGCDCFGCCAVPSSAGTINVLLNDSCSLRDADDATKCPRCEQNSACQNECGTCELCQGRKRRDLPMECRGMPNDEEPTNVCDEGQQVCSADAPCPTDFYCQLGCCLPVVL
jgi:hypothetical protein